MQIESENSVRLSLTLYMSKLKVNLLSEKQMCKMKLHKSLELTLTLLSSLISEITL